MLATTTVTEPHIASIACCGAYGYLQTSPEYFMKRLLAHGSGDIFHLGKVFRDEEQGRHHAREFTMLEWYRCQYTLTQLMDELDAYLAHVFQLPAAQRISYRDAFETHAGFNPHHINTHKLIDFVNKKTTYSCSTTDNRDTLLDVVMTHLIAPAFAKKTPVIMYDFPASQAGLAKTADMNGDQVAQRFELYWQGVEIANAYHELQSSTEQLRRFTQDNIIRKRLGLPIMEIDQKLLDALPCLPDCCGIAVGLDRLLMLSQNLTTLDAVMAFAHG